MVRNPKKRSRASRRAPTTVLTTDTTNFRAMVQEFTGIPAQPFTSSSFPRTRLDLFASAATPTLMRSNVNVNPLDPPTQPPYLLRPFAQKLQLRSLHPFPPSFSNTFLPPSTNSSTNSTSINYQQQQQLSEHFGFVKQPLNFNNTLELCLIIKIMACYLVILFSASNKHVGVLLNDAFSQQWCVYI